MMYSLSALVVLVGLLLSGMNYQSGNRSISTGHEGPAIVNRLYDGLEPPPPPPPPPPPTKEG